MWKHTNTNNYNSNYNFLKSFLLKVCSKWKLYCTLCTLTFGVGAMKLKQRIRTFWSALLLIAMYVCRLRHRIDELFSLFHAARVNLLIGQCEWANHGIRLLGCWFQRWAVKKRSEHNKKRENATTIHYSNCH